MYRKMKAFVAKLPRITVIEFIILAVIFLIVVACIALPMCALLGRTNMLNSKYGLNSYMVHNNTTPDEGNLIQLKNFYRDIVSEKAKVYTYYEYLHSTRNGGIPQAQGYVNENFMQTENLDIIEGRVFEPLDFTHSKGDTISIVVGYNLRDTYKIGQQYTLTASGNSSYSFNVNVVGVLKENTTIIRSRLGRTNLDNSYIIPISQYILDNVFSHSDYDMAVSTAIFTLNDINQIEDIEKAVDKAMIPLKFSTLGELSKEKMSSFATTFLRRFLLLLLLFILILIPIVFQAKIIMKKRRFKDIEKK